MEQFGLSQTPLGFPETTSESILLPKVQTGNQFVSTTEAYPATKYGATTKTLTTTQVIPTTTYGATTTYSTTQEAYPATTYTTTAKQKHIQLQIMEQSQQHQQQKHIQ